MTKAAFLEHIRSHNIPEDLVVFDDAAKDGYCIRKSGIRWEVFFRERGREYDCIGFSSESDALQYLLEELYRTYTAAPTKT